jgi:hypothetical protein
MKNPNGPIGNKTLDFLVCIAVPQPAVPLHTPLLMVHIKCIKEQLPFCSLLKPLNGKKINIGINL